MACAATKKTPKKFDTIKSLQEDFLTCGICLEYFKNPKSLTCLHKFCESCLQVYVDKLRTKPGGKFQCPMKCTEQTILPDSGIKQLKTDFTMNNLEEFLCIKESERKSDKRSVKDIFGDKSNVKEVICSEHEEKICELFCEEDHCQVPVCIKCVSSEHNGHKVAELEPLIQNSKHVIDDLIKEVNCDINVTVKKKEIFQDFLIEVEGRAEELTASVDTHLEDIISQMRQKANQLKDEIKQETNKQSVALNVLLEENDNHTEAYANIKTLLSQAQSISNPKELFHLKQDAQQKLQALRHNNNTDKVLRSTMTIDNNIDFLSQDLLQLVVKETEVTITRENGEIQLEETEDEINGEGGSSDDSINWEVSSDGDDDDDDDEY